MFSAKGDNKSFIVKELNKILKDIKIISAGYKFDAFYTQASLMTDRVFPDQTRIQCIYLKDHQVKPGSMVFHLT